jgi:hypothetical protein
LTLAQHPNWGRKHPDDKISNIKSKLLKIKEQARSESTPLKKDLYPRQGTATTLLQEKNSPNI